MFPTHFCSNHGIISLAVSRLHGRMIIVHLSHSRLSALKMDFHSMLHFGHAIPLIAWSFSFSVFMFFFSPFGCKNEGMKWSITDCYLNKTDIFYEISPKPRDKHRCDICCTPWGYHFWHTLSMWCYISGICIFRISDLYLHR